MINLLKVISVLTGTIIAVGAYRYFKRNSSSNKTMDLSDIQYIDKLSIPSALDWVNRILEKNNKRGKYTLNILPNELTIQAFNGNLKLNSKADLEKCILLIILDPDKKETVFRKLVIPSVISEDLSVLRDNKIYEIPIE